MRIFVVRIYYIDISILVDISTGFLKFALAYSIDTFIFAVYILLINTGQKADIVSFIIVSLKRLRVAGTLNINEVG